MRVSTKVKEYIEKQVRAKFPKTENELQLEQNEQLVNTTNNEYYARLEQAKTQIINELMAEKGITPDIAKVQDLRYNHPFSTCGTTTRNASDLDRQARQRAINEKIDDIIVSLELGGTKADLEKMLAEI